MKIILFSRRQLSHTAAEICQLFDALRLFGFDYAVNEEFAPLVTELTGMQIPPEKVYGHCVGRQPTDSLMVCYGGDGTLLEGVHRLCGAPIPVMGINAGHLGFLTSAPSAGLNLIFEEVAAGRLTTEPRSMIEATGDYAEQPDTELGLNEFTVQRHGAGMISVETYVDEQMVATYHGDGVIVSTPTGSTAYSLSAGGPVVAPTCACLVISPLAPHNLTMRPVVVPDTSDVALRVRTRRSAVTLSLDNTAYDVADDTEIRVSLSEKRIFLGQAHNISFYDTLRDKMMWGVDIRD